MTHLLRALPIALLLVACSDGGGSGGGGAGGGGAAGSSGSGGAAGSAGSGGSAAVGGGGAAGAGGGCSNAETSGEPDLTAVPTLSANTASAGSVVTVSVPVDAETGYISVNLSNADPSTPSIAGGMNMATSGSETVDVNVTLLGTAAAGTYFPIINLCESEQACLVDQVGIAYTRGTSVSEPYNRVSYSGTTTADPTQTCYSIPTLTVQ